ncbi:MAG: hypothetical protein WAW07_14860 [Bacteroidales bacterium]
MKLSRALAFIVSVFLSGIASAQYYNTGQDPAALKWMQIKTDRFTLIYPETYGDAGIDFARSLDKAWSQLSHLYPVKKFRIPVVIHNHTTGSNGYVAWAPDRMEIYPTPEQNSIPLDANTQLAIHELTHVMQMESLNKGFTKVMSVISGQQFTGVVAGLLPLWHLEGDAVFSESALTGSGRGRTASFQKQLKALMIERGNVFSYDKSVNGSFRDFVPDYYQYGYQMMAWSYSKYDQQMWQKALRLTGNAPFLINPVNLSLRKSASLTKNRLFNETFDSLRTAWTKDNARSASLNYTVLNPSKGKKFINYHSPVLVSNDEIIAVKTSLSDPPSFVLIRPSDNSEKRIHIPGNIYPYYISYGNDRLVWVETHSDPRWENREWSDIMVMDLHNDQTRRLTGKSRYMSASISPDGSLVAAVENRTDNRNTLNFLDAVSGDKLHSVVSPGNAALQRPQWDASGAFLTVIHLTEQGEGILRFSLEENAWQTLIEPGTNDIQSSFLRNDSLFYVSSLNGTENIYLRKPDGTVTALTRSTFGATDISINGSKMLFSDYSSSGNNISILRIPQTIETGMIFNSPDSYLINRFKLQKPPAENASGNVYFPSPYRKWKNLFRFHSWMPFYADIDEIQDDLSAVAPGFTLMTQNNLSSLISTFGYEYTDQRHKFHSKISWMGWYPMFESGIEYGNPVYVEKFSEDVSDPDILSDGYSWNNKIYLPLAFRGGTFTKQLYLSASSSIKNDYIYLRDKDTWDNLQNQLTGRIYFSNYRRQAIRDIYPRFAQTIDLSYSDYPFDSDIYGDIMSGKVSLYFPGGLKNHGFRLRFEAEKQNPGKYILGNRISFARGYIGARKPYLDKWYDNIISRELRTGSIDYFMPIAYPDFRMGGIMYMTRIRSDIFYDQSVGKDSYIFISDLNEEGRRVLTMENHDYSETFRSFGVQLMADFYLFRIPFMISSGVEASWRAIGETPYLKMLFGIDIFGMNIGKNKGLSGYKL